MMTNPYADGLACEHEFMIGPPCNDRATWLTGTGTALCAKHFDDLVNVSAWPVRVRADAERLP